MAENTNDGYLEKISDKELLTLADFYIQNSSSSFLDTSELSDERQKATYEFAMQPEGHLTPQGVSRIVSSDTVEAIEGYSAILSELLFNNNKLVKFNPTGSTPTDLHKARAGAEFINHCVFVKNKGWRKLNTWTKAALLWKASAMTWYFTSEDKVTFEEYDSISPEALDILLADSTVTLTNDVLELDESAEVYLDVRLKRSTTTSKLSFEPVPTESLRLVRGSTGIEDSPFVGIESELTRSEIRARYPEKAEEIDWAESETTTTFSQAMNQDAQARKRAIGVSTVLGTPESELEANKPATLLRFWTYVDRDGDGLAELKYFVIVGKTILEEEDADHIQVSLQTPIEIPFELEGLSMADMVRHSTLATTAILRGFVENTYLTNYAPKVADPNVVDFSALRNMKPKQIIASNGNPNAAVASLPPEQISTGTVPLLDHLQGHKEQASGLSKAAQGLNDSLYVSGNSEQKVQSVQSAAQTRIQHVARRFMETGLADFARGLYMTAKKELRGQSVGDYIGNSKYKDVSFDDLPSEEYLVIEADVGDASNQTVLQKTQMIKQVLMGLKEAGAGGVTAPEAAANIAHKALEALGVDPLEYIVDYTTDEYKQKAEESRKQDLENEKKQAQAQEQLQQLEQALQKANVDYTNVQSQNAIQDNMKQLMVALDKSEQEWAKIALDAGKEGQSMPTKTSIDALHQQARKLVEGTMSLPSPGLEEAL